ncbi:hypothetical protein GGG16DRAFT_66376, partial [Schizophyllum commune]
TSATPSTMLTALKTLLCPHIPLAKEICDCVGTFDMACLRMLRRVEEVSPGHPLCPLIRTRILVLRDFAVVISDIMTGLFDMTSNIRELIISDQRPEALLSDTHHNHQALLRLLGRALDDGCRARDELLSLEQQVVRALSYPRLLQSLLAYFLGSDWSRREMARTQVPPVIRALCDDLQSIVSLTARLKDCVADMPQRFSVPQLAVIRSAEAKTRDEVAKIVKQAAWELYSNARSARETANFLQELAKEQLGTQIL